MTDKEQRIDMAKEDKLSSEIKGGEIQPQLHPDEPSPNKVFEAVLAVMDDVKTVPRDKENTHWGTMYASIDGIIDAVHESCVKNKLLILPDVLNYQKDGSGHTVELLMNYQHALHCMDRFTTKSVGYSNDSQGFGYAKAHTAAYKTSVLKTFMLSAGEVDPEELYEHDDVARLDIDMCIDIRDRLEETGFDEQKILEHYDVSRLENIPADKYRPIIDSITKHAADKSKRK